MRILSIALCFVASVAGVSRAQTTAATPPKPATAPKRADANAVTSGVPGLPGPRLKLSEGPVIDGKKEKLADDIAVDLGPAGQTVVRSGWRMMKAFDSTGRRRWTMDLSRQGEIGGVTAIGWRGSEMWVADSRYSQIALVDNGTVTKSLELPAWVRPPWSNRKSFPVFGSMEVYSLFADGSMIVLARRPHSVVGTVGYDSTMQYVLHVTENGIIDKAIARFPSLDYAMRVAYVKAARDRAERIPNAWLLSSDFWPRFRVSPDGMRTVIVTVDTSHATFDTVVVAAMNEKGGPVFSRKFGLPRTSYSEGQIDSIAALRFRGTSGEYRAQRARALPRTIPAVRDVTLGRDYSVWVTLRETADGAKPIVGIGAAGQFTGTFYVPRTFWLKAADRNNLWIVDYRPTFRDVVRHTVTKP